MHTKCAFAVCGSPLNSACEFLRNNLICPNVPRHFLHRCAANVVWTPHLWSISDLSVELWMLWIVLHRVPSVLSCWSAKRDDLESGFTAIVSRTISHDDVHSRTVTASSEHRSPIQPTLEVYHRRTHQCCCAGLRKRVRGLARRKKSLLQSSTTFLLTDKMIDDIRKETDSGSIPSCTVQGT